VWKQKTNNQYRYSKYLLCDSIIGFASCRVESYRNDLLNKVEEYYKQEDIDIIKYIDDEDIAIWLIQPLIVKEVKATQIIRQLAIWTKYLEIYIYPTR
jgi:hypothetical protein